MISVVKNAPRSRWQFDFHGRAGEYFLICLTNFFLCIITLGIYTPWAIVRCRRYIYKNMELNGARFGYHATGLTVFLSWLMLAFFSWRSLPLHRIQLLNWCYYWLFC